MNKAKKLILGGVLVAGAAGITAGGLAVSGSNSHSAKPAAQAQAPVAKGNSVSLNGGSVKVDCKAVHEKILANEAVDHMDAFSCDNDELAEISKRTGNSSQSLSETCQDINMQVQRGKADHIDAGLKKLCNGEEQAVERKLAATDQGSNN